MLSSPNDGHGLLLQYGHQELVARLAGNETFVRAS